MTFEYVYTGLLQGLILALVAYAVMIPFRLLNFPDLTSEGAYPLGGAVCTGLLLGSVPPWVALIVASFSAGLLGVCTGLIHLRLKVNSLLAGIILSTMIYSVNLRLLSKPNVALFNTSSVFSETHLMFNLGLLAMVLMTLVVLLILFLRTEFGLKLRAVGLNKKFSGRYGISVSGYTLLGLFFSGCFTGLAGGFMVQLQHYMDVGMGVGVVIHALAALMIGEAMVGRDRMSQQVISPLIGALVYQQIQGVVLSLGLAPSDLKFFTGGLVLMVIAIQRRAEENEHGA
jgi:putative ABC transport system permease protein